MLVRARSASMVVIVRVIVMVKMLARMFRFVLLVMMAVLMIIMLMIVLMMMVVAVLMMIMVMVVLMAVLVMVVIMVVMMAVLVMVMIMVMMMRVMLVSMSVLRMNVLMGRRPLRDIRVRRSDDDAQDVGLVRQIAGSRAIADRLDDHRRESFGEVVHD